MEKKIKDLFLQSINQRSVNTAPFTAEQIYRAIKALEFCANDVELAAQAMVEHKYVSLLDDALRLTRFAHDSFPFERQAFHWYDTLQDIAKIYSIEIEEL